MSIYDFDRMLASVQAVKEFNPDQPRDEDGKFAATGGGGDAGGDGDSGVSFSASPAQQAASELIDKYSQKIFFDDKSSVSLIRGDATGRKRMIAHDEFRSDARKIGEAAIDFSFGDITASQATTRITTAHDKAAISLGKWAKSYGTAKPSWDHETVSRDLGRYRDEALGIVKTYAK